MQRFQHTLPLAQYQIRQIQQHGFVPWRSQEVLAADERGCTPIRKIVLSVCICVHLWPKIKA
jgi:hypothetical protein